MRHAAIVPNVPKSVVLAKTYYGQRLLELGRLTYGQFREITGWQPDECEAVLQHMKRTRVAEWVNGCWRLRA